MSDEQTTEAEPGLTNTSSLELNLDQIIAEINKPYDGKLPADAIRAAQANRETITPKLIQLLASETEKIRQKQEFNSSGAIISLLLLTEFKAKNALPTIIEAISLPEDGAYDLFGDTTTENLCLILASLAVEPFNDLEQIISNPAIDIYVRSSTMRSYLCLFKHGRISREDVIQRLNKHLNLAIQHEDGEQATCLITNLADLAPENIELIELAYERELVDEFWIGQLNSIQERIQLGVEEELSELRHLDALEITDTVKELERWACFQQESYQKSEISDSEYDDDLEEYLDDDFIDTPLPRIGLSEDWNFRADAHEPISRPHRAEDAKIGRNDACPCGSGKKFKKCCGSRVNN